jgi:hypothetical protein
LTNEKIIDDILKTGGNGPEKFDYFTTIFYFGPGN